MTCQVQSDDVVGEHVDQFADVVGRRRIRGLSDSEDLPVDDRTGGRGRPHADVDATEFVVMPPNDGDNADNNKNATISECGKTRFILLEAGDDPSH